MNKLFDLRFVIGSFFTLVGILLLGYSFIAVSEDNTQIINRWCGIIFIVFGVIMIVLSLGKNADDELLEE
ncbi:MAG TPA: hypothetical protein VMY77_06255 [Chitinophagaceae bacterium]|nr:hypothetical protein [Chitinophagaceae bacterium]